MSFWISQNDDKRFLSFKLYVLGFSLFMKHGVLFGESIKTEKIKRRRYDDEYTSSPFHPRGWVFLAAIICGGLLLLFKLMSLQIFQGQKYRALADSNRTRMQLIPAQRGIIFDRNGEPLVFNIPGFLEAVKGKDGKIKVDHISKEEALKAIAQGKQNIYVASLREYPFKDSMSHLLGYIGQISQEEFGSPEFPGYLANDLVGKNGIEREYEYLLRGKDGRQLIEVDAVGKIVRPLGRTDPIPGQDIKLTIDGKLQKAVFAAANDVKKGAIIVSRPNGEILSMVSKPSFDPNLFTLDKTYSVSTTSAYTEVSQILLDSDNQPLLNRVIGGTYPPGSTFKLITAAAGLEDKIINEKYSIKDTGVLKVGEFSYANWYFTDYGKTESGNVDVIRAISRSNDIFFYKLAEKINVDRLSDMAQKFGVGKVLGIDLGGEASGLLPSKSWKEKTIKEDWYLGDTFHYGIGQGYLLTTPLQVNLWTAAIANDGILPRPHILSQNSQGKGQRFLSEKTISLIRQGMIDSCSKGGVAYPLFDFKVKNAKLKVNGKDIQSVASSSADYRKISVACKTGTAQHGGEKTLPHAWITLFAPAYNPQVVVTVLVESAGGGSDIASPIAKKVLEAYFSK